MAYSTADLDRIRDERARGDTNWVKIGLSSCGIAAGAEEVLATIKDEVRKNNLSVVVRKTGCLGMCHAEPLVEVKVDGLPRVVYGKVTPEVAHQIVERHIMNRMLVHDHIFELGLEE